MNIAIIPARGGSKGIPRKNIRPLLGIPLITHSIKDAQEAQLVDQVYVSTDVQEIAEISGAAETKGPGSRINWHY